MDDESIALLRSIDASLKKLVAAADRRAAANGPAIADDRDLDSQYGDEDVKFLPRDWVGSAEFKGRKMSECPPDLLDMLASSFDYFAKKNDEKKAVDSKNRPKSTYDRRSAGRARGWAKRLRDGWKPRPPAPVDDREYSGDDGFGSNQGDAFEEDAGDGGGF